MPVRSQREYTVQDYFESRLAPARRSAATRPAPPTGMEMWNPAARPGMDEMARQSFEEFRRRTEPPFSGPLAAMAGWAGPVELREPAGLTEAEITRAMAPLLSALGTGMTRGEVLLPENHPGRRRPVDPFGMGVAGELVPDQDEEGLDPWTLGILGLSILGVKGFGALRGKVGAKLAARMEKLAAKLKAGVTPTPADQAVITAVGKEVAGGAAGVTRGLKGALKGALGTAWKYGKWGTIPATILLANQDMARTVMELPETAVRKLMGVPTPAEERATERRREEALYRETQEIEEGQKRARERARLVAEFTEELRLKTAAEKEVLGERARLDRESMWEEARLKAMERAFLGRDAINRQEMEMTQQVLQRYGAIQDQYTQTVGEILRDIGK